jgi:nucleotide-binding universal stress UspA family protein
MKVLIPLDGSVLSECMLGPALQLAPQGELHLVRVLGDEAHRTSEAREAAEGYLEAERERLEGLGASVRWYLEGGDAAEKILVVADEVKPDFVAMATHGDTGSLRRVRGSVTERVLRTATFPLLIANPRAIPKTHEDFFNRLLVPLDGSELADRILPHVERLAKVFGSEVVLLHVQRESRVAPGVFDPSLVVKELEGQRDRLNAQGIRARCWAALGDEAEEILRAAEEADLVCMTSHGRSGLSRWWFGSVAEQVLRVCNRPLLVVRPQATP